MTYIETEASQSDDDSCRPPGFDAVQDALDAFYDAMDAVLGAHIDEEPLSEAIDAAADALRNLEAAFASLRRAAGQCRTI